MPALIHLSTNFLGSIQLRQCFAIGSVIGKEGIGAISSILVAQEAVKERRGGLAGDGSNWSFGLCNADGFIILEVKQGSLVPS